MEEKKDLETPVQNPATSLGSTEPKAEMATPPVVETPKPKINRKLLMIVGVILLLLAAGSAAAYFLVFKNQTQSSPFGSPEPTTEMADPTADWRNISRKYWTFKTPVNWHYLECSDSAIYVGPEHESDRTTECNFEASGIVWVNKEKADYKIPTNLFDQNSNEPVLKVLEKKEITVANQTAVWQHEEVSRAGEFFVPLIRVYLKTKDATYIITFSDLSQKQTFDQILSTFKFVEDTSDWKTYTNTDFDFSFRYPNDFLSEEKGKNQITFTKQNTPSQILSFDITIDTSSKYASVLDKYKKLVFDSTNTDINNGVKISGLTYVTGAENPITFLGAVISLGNNGVLIFESRDNDIDDSTFNQILSTFKFTN